MSDKLTQRLNQVLPKITSDQFLAGSGIGNEIAFHIFDYPPKEELRVRAYLETLIANLKRRKPALRVTHINLFDFVLEYLRSRGLLEKSLHMQREKGNEALMKALKGVLSEEKLAAEFGKVARPEDNDLVLISGVGSAYPLLRSHTLLNNLHSVMGQTPLVMFYPGRYDQTSLRLFGKTGTSGGTPGAKRRHANYYRAFQLIN
ncbi:MAG: DUF1788 domain-containing protein [Rhodothermales bacterium]|nr:DUF1788 domain-containing protein [Rhodothermales bacterium]